MKKYAVIGLLVIGSLSLNAERLDRYLGKVTPLETLATPGAPADAMWEVRQYSRVVLDFTASWCPPCQALKPKLDGWAKEYPDVLFVKIDADKFGKTVYPKWAVRAMPTLVFLKGGDEVVRVKGANITEIKKQLHYFFG